MGARGAAAVEAVSLEAGALGRGREVVEAEALEQGVRGGRGTGAGRQRGQGHWGREAGEAGTLAQEGKA